MRRTAGAVAVMAAALAIVGMMACGGDSVTNPRDTWSGTYTLTAINGQPLPYVLANGGTGVYYEKDEVLSEQLVLYAPSALAETEIDRVTTSAGVTVDTTNYSGGVAWIRGDSIATDIGWGARSGTTLTLEYLSGADTTRRTYVRR